MVQTCYMKHTSQTMPVKDKPITRGNLMHSSPKGHANSSRIAGGTPQAVADRLRPEAGLPSSTPNTVFPVF
jgi:hypothetical protein